MNTMTQTSATCPANRLQCDEIWAFIGAKTKDVSARKKEGWGDVWTWTGIDADSNWSFRVSWVVARPDGRWTSWKTAPAASRAACRSPRTGTGAYLEAVEGAFGLDVRLRAIS